jgi:hypothetical protein
VLPAGEADQPRALRPKYHKSCSLPKSFDMNLLRKLALAYLGLMLAFGYGVAVMEFELWPYAPLRAVKDFVQGDVSENTSLFQKLTNDADILPVRHMHDVGSGMLAQRRLRPAVNASGKAFRERRDDVLVYSTAESGAWLIYGVFDFEEALHGAILVDASGTIKKAWIYSQAGVEWSDAPDTRAVSHGFELLPDGSFAARLGTTLYRMSHCGEVMWEIGPGFHHSVTSNGAGGLWTFVDNAFVLVDEDSGEILDRIETHELLVANPNIYPFEIRTTAAAWKLPDEPEYLEDPFHHNDADPLVRALAPHYPMFKEGDLLVSFRELNLLFVMRPATREVLWFRQGLTSRQHDGEWNDRGTVTVFDNRMHYDSSRITELSINAHQATTLLDGANYAMFSAGQGNHSVLPDESVLVVSTHQGRVLHVDSDGSTRFELFNAFNDHEVLRVYNAEYVSDEQMQGWEKCDS